MGGGGGGGGGGLAKKRNFWSKTFQKLSKNFPTTLPKNAFLTCFLENLLK